jgi:hypothetical protein
VQLNPVRSAARALRLRIEAGELLSLEEARAACVTMADALTVFDVAEDREDGTYVTCCDAPARITGGIFGNKVACPRCGAEAVDATSPMFSPLLERTGSSMEIPSPAWIDAFGERTWLVTHEGNR